MKFKLKDSKFLKLYESTYSEFAQGAGFLAGDVVRFKKGYESSEWFKAQAQQLQAQMKGMGEGGRNIRISTLKTAIPRAAGAFGMQNNPAEMADIVEELGPGRWTNVMTVPLSVLELVDNGANMPEVSDKDKREDTSHIKPQEKPTQVSKDSPKEHSSNERNLTKGDTKNPKGTKWDDRKPGAGGGGAVAPIVKESVTIEDEYLKELQRY